MVLIFCKEVINFRTIYLLKSYISTKKLLGLFVFTICLNSAEVNTKADYDVSSLFRFPKRKTVRLTI